MTKTDNQVVDYYNQIAQKYDEDRFGNSYGRFIDAQERRVLNKLEVEQAGTLDLPCGTGRLTNYAREGADASEEMLKVARERHPDKSFTLTDATHTTFADGTFDTVLSFHFLMHLDEAVVQAVVKEMHRVLAKGGRWICDIPSQRRRSLTHRKQELWHGNTSMTVKQMRELCQGRFEVESVHGIMLAPVHRLPRRIRGAMCRVDYALANSWLLKNYSSYLIFELRKI